MLADGEKISKKSRLRGEIEHAMSRMKNGLVPGIYVINLDLEEHHIFQSYPEALAFVKGRKGRWYITANLPSSRATPWQSERV